MDEFSSQIEALEHRWMRSWIQGDRKQLKAMTARSFILLFGGVEAVILDRTSWLEAANTRFICQAYRFESVYVRRHGSAAVFATQMHLKATLGDADLDGAVWLFDLWTRSVARRKWRLTERSISRTDGDARLVDAVRAMQLWH